MFNLILIVISFIFLVAGFILYILDLTSSEPDNKVREKKLPKLSSYGFFSCVIALIILIIPSFGYVF